MNRRSALYPAIPPKIRQHGGSPARTKKAALRCDAGNPMWKHSTAVETLAGVCGLADHMDLKPRTHAPLTGSLIRPSMTCCLAEANACRETWLQMERDLEGSGSPSSNNRL